jgi:hypothetical protein
VALFDWSVRSTGTTGALLSVAYDGARWVAPGKDKVHSVQSTDGLNWATVNYYSAASAVQGERAAVSGGLWIASHSLGRILTSPSAALDSWTEQTVDGLSGGTRFGAIYYGDGLWVAANRSGRIWTSDNGTSWTESYAGEVGGIEYRTGIFAAGLHLVGGRYSNGYIVASVDGLSWAVAPPPSEVIDVFGIVYSDLHGMFVASTSIDDGPDEANSAAMTSAGGVTWTIGPPSTPGWPRSPTAGRSPSTGSMSSPCRSTTAASRCPGMGSRGSWRPTPGEG